MVRGVVAGGKPGRGKRSMDVDPEVSLSTLRREYREACEASNAIARGVGDPAAPVKHQGRTHDLRGALLSVIGEDVPPRRPRRHHP